MKKTSEASPARDVEDPPDAPSDASPDDPVLEFVRPIAVFALVAVLVGRAFGSSLRGLAIGFGRYAERFELLGATLSQAFLIVGTIVSLGLVLAILRASASSFVRFVVVTCGGLVTLAALLSMATRMPEGTLLISAGMASVLALVAAWDTVHIPFARVTSIIVGAVGFGALTRVISLVLMLRDRAPSGYRVAGQVISSLGLFVDGVAMLIAVGFVSSKNRRATSPATIVALGVALVATRFALGGAAEDAGMLSVLFDRASRGLIVRPEPSTSHALVTFLAFAAPAVAIAVLATPTLTPALSGAIALMLLAHGAPDVPLCSLMITMAAVSTILASRDHRGIWAAIKRGDTSAASSESTDEGRSRSSDG